MRIKSLLAALAVLFSVSLVAPNAAQAGWFGTDFSDGWGRTRTIKHRVYYPRYRHVYKSHAHTDPYAYSYEPRRYYTKSTSRYWVSASKAHRHRKLRGMRKFRYYPAWGHKKSRRSARRWSR